MLMNIDATRSARWLAFCPQDGTALETYDPALVLAFWNETHTRHRRLEPDEPFCQDLHPAIEEKSAGQLLACTQCGLILAHNLGGEGHCLLRDMGIRGSRRLDTFGEIPRDEAA